MNLFSQLGLTCSRKHFEKRLDRALNNVEGTIDNLNAQLKILLVEPARTQDRQNRVLDVRRDVTKPYHNFRQFFEELKAEEKGDIRSLALGKLWEQFRQWHVALPDLDGKVGNIEDPGDGQLYGPDHVDRANALLKDLHQAWTNMDDSPSYPPPEKLTKMGRICLVLTGMKQQQLLEDFLDAGICDDDLHLERDQLQRVLREDHLDYVGTFLSEQYRAKSRLWGEGDHVKMEDEEPLPLEYGKPYKRGSCGMVTRVRDSGSGAIYALKQQIVGPVESRNARARKHLEDEMKRLRGLQHKHVIKLVKSYERAEAYGLLLAPAATSDLLGLLDRFRKNRFCAMEGCSDQEWLRPTFLTAFGCLSQGLAYIHGKDIRHKDVKPSNILYQKAVGEDKARFLWADFGLAYDFSATGNSKTDSTNIYSKRYVAPEILKTSINPARDERRASMMSLDRIVEHVGGSTSVEADGPEEKILSNFREDVDTSHGRKTDIFSLGCVFFELLAVLIHDRLPMDRVALSSASRSGVDNQQMPDGGRIAAAPIATDDDMFCKHIKDLKQWAMSHSTPSTSGSIIPGKAALAPLFTLATKMISGKADDRPLIDAIIREIASIGKDYFCLNCWAELPTEHKVMKSTESSAAPMDKAVKDKAVKSEGTASVSPESPVSSDGGGMSLLRRSTAALRNDSHGPSLGLMRIISR